MPSRRAAAQMAPTRSRATATLPPTGETRWPAPVSGGTTGTATPVTRATECRASCELAEPAVAEMTVSPGRSPVRTVTTATPLSPLPVAEGTTAAPWPAAERMLKTTGTCGTA
jgi:hypothetical protein